MKDWKREELRDKHLQILINKYGFESEPTLYYSRLAWKDIWNERIYFQTAIGWIFNED